MHRKTLNSAATAVKVLDRLTAAPRRRHAETLFLGGSPSRWDGWRSRLFFEISAREWARRGDTAVHIRPFATGLTRCRQPRVALDLGTGSGESAALLAESRPSAHVTGVDGSARMIRLARARHEAPNLNFVRADFAALPMATGQCDLICMLNALPVLDELARVSTPDAEVLVANTYFGAPEGEWLRRWEAAGFVRAATESIGEGSWQLFRRQA